MRSCTGRPDSASPFVRPGAEVSPVCRPIDGGTPRCCSRSTSRPKSTSTERRCCLTAAWSLASIARDADLARVELIDLRDPNGLCSPTMRWSAIFGMQRRVICCFAGRREPRTLGRAVEPDHAGAVTCRVRVAWCERLQCLERRHGHRSVWVLPHLEWMSLTGSSAAADPRSRTCSMDRGSRTPAVVSRQGGRGPVSSFATSRPAPIRG